MNKRDYTEHQWFSEGKVSRRGNLLLEIIPNFGYWKKFGQNTLDRLTYISRNEYIDYLTGYVIGWDKTHRCDRCGEKLLYKGSYTFDTAYRIKIFPLLKRQGLCQDCEREMESEQKKDREEGILTSDKQYNSYFRKTIPNTYKKRYIWL